MITRNEEKDEKRISIMGYYAYAFEPPCPTRRKT